MEFDYLPYKGVGGCRSAGIKSRWVCVAMAIASNKDEFEFSARQKLGIWRSNGLMTQGI